MWFFVWFWIFLFVWDWLNFFYWFFGVLEVVWLFVFRLNVLLYLGCWVWLCMVCCENVFGEELNWGVVVLFFDLKMCNLFICVRFGGLMLGVFLWEGGGLNWFCCLKSILVKVEWIWDVFLIWGIVLGVFVVFEELLEDCWCLVWFFLGDFRFLLLIWLEVDE